MAKPKNVEAIYAPSPLQKGMLYHSMMAPESGVYVVQLSFDLEGELDSKAFRDAWQNLLERHTIFRTLFLGIDRENPLQVVRQKVVMPWREEDWRDLDEKEQGDRYTKMVRHDRFKGFDISRAPLMRLLLVQLGDHSWRFLWTLHHALIDGWSVPVVLGEFMTIYRQLCAKQPVQLPPARSFQDYIGWLQKQDLSECEPFWRKYLQGFTAATQIHIDTRLGIEGNKRGNPSEYRTTLPNRLTDRITQVARERALTPNVLMMGAWALLLQRYSNTDDLVFGATVSGRPGNLEGVESMVGAFINAQPVRARIEGQVTVAQWLKQLHGEQIQREQYMFTPLVDIQGWSDITGGTPLFDTLLVFENYPSNTSGGMGSELDMQISGTHAYEQTNYLITLTIAPEDVWCLLIKYSQDQLHEATVARILAHYQHLLEQLVEHIDAPIAEVTMLDNVERTCLLHEWNAPLSAPKQGMRIMHQFESQVEATPNNIALAFGTQTMSYEALNSSANRLAHRLINEGIAPQERVGICMPRGPEMMIAILATLKAGGAYVPIDPKLPLERLDYLLGDAGLMLLLSTEDTADNLPPFQLQLLNLVCLDSEDMSSEPDHNPQVNVDADHQAYMIYTSGSTGNSKGSMIHHGALENYLSWALKAYDVTAGSGTVAHLSIGFDASITALFPPLLTGGCLMLPAEGEELKGLSEAIVKHTHLSPLKLTPAHLDALRHMPAIVGAEEQTLATRKHCFVVGGDALPPELLAHWRTLLPSARFINEYGPTETVVGCCIYEVQDLGDMNTVPIGKPIAGVTHYVLDRQGFLAGTGLAGELYIGGHGVARGYFMRPGLTAARFLPDPFSTQPGARLYRSGDMARYQEDGQLVFLGRIDRQVKVRGFRIEPQEVESALLNMNDVVSATVMVREDQPGNKRLVAYVVTRSETTMQSAEMREVLSATLPHYMVPSLIVFLPEMPLTVNGKVNVDALPDPSLHDVMDSGYTEPRNATEKALCQIWADILNLPRVGITDHFFEIGGHSLLAAQVLSRVRKQLDTQLDVHVVFENPTIADLAQKVEQTYRTAIRNVPLEPIERKGGLPMSFAQERLWVQDQLERPTAAYNIPAAFDLTGDLNESVFVEVLRDLSLRHETLRTTFGYEDGEGLQYIQEDAVISYTKHDLRSEAAPREKAIELMRQESGTPFNLETGPLWRVHLYHLQDEHYLLQVNMHHIITDALSMAVFITEIQALYTAGMEDLPHTLPELPVQYADYATWQRERLSGDRFEHQLNYWRKQLTGMPPLLDLPLDHARGTRRSYRGATESFTLPQEVLQNLKELGRWEGATLFMTVLAVFDALLAYHAKQQDFAVGSPIANRNQNELEGLIGFFINTLVLRANVSRDMSFSELLRQVRATALGAFEHQELPFQNLLQALDIDRDLSYSPLYQVAFVVQNTEISEANLPNLKIEVADGAQTAVKFDLILTVEEAPDGVLHGIFEYNCDLFERETIQGFIQDLETLARCYTSQPQARLDTAYAQIDMRQKKQREAQTVQTQAISQAGLKNLGRRRRQAVTVK